MPTKEDLLQILSHLNYLRGYLRELQQKKLQHIELAKRKDAVAFLRKLRHLVCYKEFLMIDHMISKISEIIELYAGITRLRNSPDSIGSLRTLLVGLNLLLAEEITKGLYPDELWRISKYTEGLLVNAYTQRQSQDHPQYKHSN